MPNYNSSHTLYHSVQAVLSQSVEALELIIIDDASTDNSIEIIQGFQDERIILLRNTSNRGVGYARKCGLSKATGDWLAFCDSDDIWNRNHLSRHQQRLIHSQSIFFYSNYIVGSGYPHVDKEVLGPKRVNLADIAKCNYIGCSTVILKNLDNISELYPTIRRRQDWVFWSSYMREFDCDAERLEDYSVYYYKSKSSLSNRKKFQLIIDTFIAYRQMKYPALRAFFMLFIFLYSQLEKNIIYRKKVTKKVNNYWTNE